MSDINMLRAKLATDKKNAPKLVGRARLVRSGLGEHTGIFSALPIPLSDLDDQIAEVEKAHVTASTGLKSAIAVRKLACRTLGTTLDTYLVYVQGLADESPQKAALIIGCAGLEVAEGRHYTKPLLEARPTPAGVELHANAGLLYKGKCSRFFNWQYSLDGGKTWISVTSTAIARTTIAGLPVPSTCWFRASATDSKGQTEWSQAVSLALH